jgi:hypothetical protein
MKMTFGHMTIKKELGSGFMCDLEKDFSRLLAMIVLSK